MPSDANPKRSLRDRLRHAARVHSEATRARESESPAGGAPSGNASSLDAGPPREALAKILGGEWRETDAGPVFVREVWFPLAHRHGRARLSEVTELSDEELGTALGESAVPPVESLGFFDLETTGLSGGTGTYFFLAGLGSFAQRSGELSFRLRQYFLADLTHERALLALLRRDLNACSAVVTYNGRGFDLPLVETRMLLAREEIPAARERNFDLIYPVRRLYRHRLPTCRLADAERELLAVARGEDVPGWKAPAIYFDYLRAGRIAPLRGVLAHNADDVLSTTLLLAHLASLFRSEELAPPDTASVARWWEYRSEPERARTLYASALPRLEGSDDWFWAAERHAFLCKRAGERDEAARLWRRLWSRGNRRAGLELAKHLEHHARDLAAAEDVTRRLSDGAPRNERDALAHRLRRLERKQLARPADADGSRA